MAQINKPGLHFSNKLYTGNGGTQSITGVGFQPDFTWIKYRNDTYGHRLYDSVRGTTKEIYSNNNGAENTVATGLTAFGTDGFTLGSSSGVNYSSGTYVSWNWKASGSTASNSNGSITSTVSANTTAGFSIVKYTGTSSSATVGHGLGVVPKMIITKQLSGTSSWGVYHVSRGNGVGMILNETGSGASSSTYWNNTSPTSSVFSIGSDAVCNANGQDFIAYCFAEKKGFSKFGSYTGNGSTDGTFVYTGFKPAFVFSKDTASGENWFIHDNKRDAYNPVDTYLRPNLSNTEGTAHHYDFYSNGFKNKYAGGSLNTSGRTIVYMAFAENPIVGSNNVPAVAR